MTKTKNECLKAGNLIRWESSCSGKPSDIGVIIQMANGDLYGYFPKEKTYININSDGIVEIRTPDASYPCPLFNNTQCQWVTGKVVWEKTPPVVELTMDEIAKKFGIPVQQLKIKK